MKVIDLTNQKFGYLYVTRRIGSKYGGTLWECKCDCGKTITVLGASLRKGHTKSCGCKREIMISDSLKTHGMTNTRIFKIWNRMNQRCAKPYISSYKYYGGRGITVCKEWKNDFQKFYEWSLKNGYADNLTIDRIDNNLGYSPENCRWITRKENCRNKRNNRLITFEGETKTISEWAELYNMPFSRLYGRINKGWDIERALKTPKMH